MHTIGYQAGQGQLNYRDEQLSRAAGLSALENISPLVVHDPGTAIVLSDHFLLNTTGNYTATKGTGGTLAIASTAGGWASIPTAASAANDYQVLSTSAAAYKLAAGLPIVFEAAVNCAEAATNKASWFVGLTSTLTTGFLQNTGAPPTSFSGAVFWKAQNAMLLKAMTSNGSTQNTSPTLATVVSGQTYVLGMSIDPKDGVTAVATYYVGTISGSPLARSFVTSGTLNLTIASLATMYFAFGVRTATTSAETLTVDYVRCLQALPLV
jgi:hypothetical protein